jgi:hypothetical protein
MPRLEPAPVTMAVLSDTDMGLSRNCGMCEWKVRSQASACDRVVVKWT